MFLGLFFGATLVVGALPLRLVLVQVERERDREREIEKEKGGRNNYPRGANKVDL